MQRKETYLSNVLLYGMFFFAWALQGVLIATYIMDKGYSASKMVVVLAAGNLTCTLLAPMVGRLQDRFGGRQVSVVGLVAAAVCGVLFVISDNFVWLVAVYAVMSALYTAVSNYIEKIATTSTRFSYSSIRIWGTIGYGVGTQAAGLLYDYVSPESLYIVYTVTTLLAVVGVLTIKREETAPSAQTAAQTEEVTRKNSFGGTFWGYVFISILLCAVRMLNVTYLPNLFQELGVSVSASTTILFVATLMEMPVILFAPRFINRISGRSLVHLVFIFTAVQVGVCAFLPILWVKIAVSVLLYSAVIMASIMMNLKIMSTIVPPDKLMTAMNLAASMKSLCTLPVQLYSGVIVDSMSVLGLYKLLTVVSLVSLAISLFLPLPADNENTARF